MMGGHHRCSDVPLPELQSRWLAKQQGSQRVGQAILLGKTMDEKNWFSFTCIEEQQYASTDFLYQHFHCFSFRESFYRFSRPIKKNQQT